MFYTIQKNVSYEIVEKKSKFIANIFYVESKEEAEEMIKKVSKQYHDAKHNCYAYRIFTKEGIIEKASDNGEPSGTASAPMLTILAKQQLANILVVVTRYFGGILLGTGGLVRAYSSACTLALEQAEMIQKNIMEEYKIEIKYEDIDQFKYFAKKYNMLILKEEYLENVIFYVAIPEKILLKKFSENEILVKKIEFLKEIYI